MTEYQRGVVKGITFEIEYPDGSTKTARIDNPGNVTGIHFDPASLVGEDERMFNVSAADWKQNPAMIIQKRGDPNIPFCTHNGCK
jgi:hypothetical protein